MDAITTLTASNGMSVQSELGTAVIKPAGIVVPVRSVAGQHVQLNMITLPNRGDYSAEQAEADIQTARVRYAEAAAAAARMKQVLDELLQGEGGQP